MSTVVIKCRFCGKDFSLDDSLFNREIGCPHCRQMQVIVGNNLGRPAAPLPPPRPAQGSAPLTPPRPAQNGDPAASPRPVQVVPAAPVVPVKPVIPVQVAAPEVPDAPEAPDAPEEVNPQKEVKAKKPKKPIKKGPIFVVVLLILFGGTGFGVYKLIKNVAANQAAKKSAPKTANAEAEKTSKAENAGLPLEERRKAAEAQGMKLNKDGTELVSVSGTVSGLKIPSGVKVIRSEAFKDYKGEVVTSIELPDTLTVIQQNAFNNISFQEITVPAGVKTIQTSALAGCKRVKIAQDNPNFRNGKCGEVIDIKAEKLIYFPLDFSGEYTVDPAVKIIGRSVFGGSHKISSIVMHDKVKNIEDYAFANSALQNIVLPAGDITVGAGAFSNLKKLESVSGNSNIRIVNNKELIDLKKKELLGLTDHESWYYSISREVENVSTAACRWATFTDLTIPGHVKIIGDYAFAYCMELKKVSINYGVTHIGNRAFDTCNFSEITIPASVESIGKDAFNGCMNLRRITIPRHLESQKDQWGLSGRCRVIYSD